MINKSIEECVGNTPLVELTRLEQIFGLKAGLFAKIEGKNPAGSVKDRVAKYLLDDGERRGLLHPGSVVVEPTSGNTGIGLAAIGAARGYRVVIVMPDTMSKERRTMMAAYGAEVVLTDGKKGMQGAIERAEELQKEYGDAFIPGQFTNPANALAHYETTGPEIYSDTEGEVDVFVAGVGTGGTITGVGRYLKEKKPSVKVVAVEPKTSAVLSGRSAGKHGLQGIGAGFVPKVLDATVYDEVFPVSDEEAYRSTRLVAKKEGVFCGISSGAALFAAIEVAKRAENAGKKVVVLFPDSGEKYLSTDLFNE